MDKSRIDTMISEVNERIRLFATSIEASKRNDQHGAEGKRARAEEESTLIQEHTAAENALIQIS